jgi:threonine dehydrogenase-like Zn-dependent dehydrogenase
MLAAVTKSPGVMVLDDVADPGPPGPEDVILRPEVVGICGSDLHMYSGEVGRCPVPVPSSALAQAAQMVCSAGRVAVVGMSAAAAPLRSGVFPEKEIDVVGSSCATAADFRAAVRLVQAHRGSIAALLTHRFPLMRVREAIDCAAGSQSGVVKVLIAVNEHNGNGGIRHE